jgi:probable addiction module antidote protein
MTKKTNRKFSEYHIEELRKKPKEAEKYLKIALEEYFRDGNKKAFYQALEDVTKANIGLSALAKKTDLNRQNIYKIFSGTSNPKLETIENILSNIGFTMTIERLS